MIYFKLFFEFFKIGLFTFGGGYAMIPLVKDVVLKYGWLNEDMFYDFIGVCESTPGPIAVNMATYIGSVQGGLFGSIIATLGVVLPSFIIIILIVTIMKKLIQNKHFTYFMKGIKPVIIALILSTGILLFLKCINHNSLNNINFDIDSIIIFLFISLSYFLSQKLFNKKMNSILLIAISGILGIIVCII